MSQYLDYWQRAAADEFGVRIVLEDPSDTRRLQNELYAARQGHVQYASIQMCMVGGEIWLVRETCREMLDGTFGRTGPQDKP